MMQSPTRSIPGSELGISSSGVVAAAAAVEAIHSAKEDGGEVTVLD